MFNSLYIHITSAAWNSRAVEHNYKLFTLNCKLISTPPDGFKTT